MASKAEEQQVNKKSKSKLWIFFLVAFLAIAAGSALTLFDGKAFLIKELSAEEMRSVTLPSFTIKLADTSSRYLKITITLETPSKKVEEELNESPYRVKDSIIRVLRNTSAESLDDPKNTDALKQQLINEVNASIKSGKVTGIYFDEFILQ